MFRKPVLFLSKLLSDCTHWQDSGCIKTRITHISDSSDWFTTKQITNLKLGKQSKFLKSVPKKKLFFSKFLL